MIATDLVRRIRNDVPMSVTIAALGREGPPSKVREGRFGFLCPYCDEMLVGVNPRKNLAHCFDCGKNMNNIDLLMLLGYDSHDAVTFLERLLKRHQGPGAKQASN